MIEQFEDRRLLATAVADYFQVSPGQTTGVSLLGNDSFAPFTTETVYGQDGQPYDELEPASWGFFTSPAHGGLANVVSGGPQQDDDSTDPGPDDYSSDFSFDYTADAGFQGYDSFTYYLSDGYDTVLRGPASTSTATVTIVVDDPPTVANDFYSTSAGTEVSGSVLGNDSGCLGAALTASIASGPAHGTLEMNDDGSFTYTPDADFSGRDSFSYSASDGMLSSTASVDIGVGDYIEAPTANDDYLQTSYQTPNGIVILANDTDPQNDPLTATIVDPPSHGSVSGPDPDGYFLYTPFDGFAGADSFTYVANDGHQDSNVAMVSVYVSPPWTPPYRDAVGHSDVYTAGENMTLDVPAGGVLANDSVADGYQLTAALVAQPQHGTVTLNSDGSFTYVPATDYVGTDHFTYQASDGRSVSGETNIVINVVVPANVVLQSFHSDGRNLQIDYAVNDAAPSHPWRIAVYASPDGVSRGPQLWSGAGGMQLGNHTLTFQPTYNDRQSYGDYRLLAVADPDGSLIESDTSDNEMQFAGGAFLVHEQLTGKTVLQIQAGDSDTVVTAAIVNSVLHITQNGQSNDYDLASIDEIHMRGHDGNDSFTSDPALAIDEWLFAGDGNANTLIGGAGDDVIFGGAGIDTLAGGDGQNRFSGGAGDNVSGDTTDPTPKIFIATSASAIQGNMLQIVVTLNMPAPSPISIDYQIAGADDLLTDDLDSPVSGTIVIPTGATSGILQLQTNDAANNDGVRSFTILFQQATGATMPNSNMTVQLYKLVQASVSLVCNAWAYENSTLSDQFVLNVPAPWNITVDFHTEDGTASSPGNYQGQSGSVVIPAGESIGRFSIPIGSLDILQRQLVGYATFRIKIDRVSGAQGGGEQTVAIQANAADGPTDGSVDVVGMFDAQPNGSVAGESTSILVGRDRTQGMQATTLHLKLIDGSAVSGVNYGGPTEFDVPLAERQVWTTVSIPILHNANLTNGQSWGGSFTIQLVRVTGGHPVDPNGTYFQVSISDKSLDAVDDYSETYLNTKISIDVMGNDTSSLWPTHVASITDPSHGTAVRVGDRIDYFPNAGFAGLDTLTYTISDNHGQSRNATVTIGVDRELLGVTSYSVAGTLDEEGEKVGILTATLDHPAPADITLHYHVLATVPGHDATDTVDASSGDGGDLYNPTGTITIRAGQTVSDPVQLKPKNDATVELNKYGLVQLDVLYTDTASSEDVVASSSTYVVHVEQGPAPFKILDNEWRWVFNPNNFPSVLNSGTDSALVAMAFLDWTHWWNATGYNTTHIDFSANAQARWWGTVVVDGRGEPWEFTEVATSHIAFNIDPANGDVDPILVGGQIKDVESQPTLLSNLDSISAITGFCPGSG